MSDNTPTITLPFDSAAQHAVLGHMLTNDNFWLQCIEKVEPSWFVDIDVGRFFKHLKKVSKDTKQGKRITPTEAKNSLLDDRTLTRTDIGVIVEKAENERLAVGLSWLQGQMTKWYQSRIFTDGIQESVNLFNSGKYEQCFSLVNQKLKTLEAATFIPDMAVDASDYMASVKRETINLTDAMSFGLSAVDRCLIDNPQTKGSLLPGDTTIIMAPISSGKSSALITTLAHNIKQGKKVLWTIHEGRVDDLVMKLWSSILGLTRTEILNLYLNNTPESQAAINYASKKIKDNLVYVPMLKAGNIIEDVAALVRSENKKMEDKNGTGFDMWVCDYPANLTTKQGSSKREKLDTVYGYVVDLAGELRLHSLCAIQVNRTAYRQNKNTNDDPAALLTLDSVSESFDPMMRATNVISLNKSDTAEKNNYVIWYICKTRSNSANWAIVAKSDYKVCRTHHESLGAFYYKGSSAMPERIEALLEQYKDKLKDGIQLNPNEILK